MELCALSVCSVYVCVLPKSMYIVKPTTSTIVTGGVRVHTPRHLMGNFRVRTTSPEKGIQRQQTAWKPLRNAYRKDKHTTDFKIRSNKMAGLNARCSNHWVFFGTFLFSPHMQCAMSTRGAIQCCGWMRLWMRMAAPFRSMNGKDAFRYTIKCNNNHYKLLPFSSERNCTCVHAHAR